MKAIGSSWKREGGKKRMLRAPIIDVGKRASFIIHLRGGQELNNMSGNASPVERRDALQKWSSRIRLH